MLVQFTCEHCGAGFKHPEVIGEDGKLEEECQTVEGRCEHLMNAGWRPVWVRVVADTGNVRRDRHLFSKGGWICAACDQQFAPTRIRPRRPRRLSPRSRA